MKIGSIINNAYAVFALVAMTNLGVNMCQAVKYSQEMKNNPTYQRMVEEPYKQQKEICSNLRSEINNLSEVRSMPGMRINIAYLEESVSNTCFGPSGYLNQAVKEDDELKRLNDLNERYIRQAFFNYGELDI